MCIRDRGLCIPRQNGKNEILQARELIGALIFRERLQVHSAHLSDTSIEAFARMDDLIDSSDWLASQVAHVRRTNGREAISFEGAPNVGNLGGQPVRGVNEVVHAG